MIPWLDGVPAFPPLEAALDDPPGLLAAGGELSPAWLLAAYRRGIFPWYSEGQPILWWSPDPRLILTPSAIRISRSLGKVLRRGRFEIRLDTAFAEVVAACAGPRRGASGTWITPEMQQAYVRMHELGYAHSVEAWDEGRLVGGLYGMALGRAFFGESMFSRATDASKACLAHLARHLESLKFAVIDCQMTTAHLVSLGAHEVPRAEFCRLIELHADDGPPPGRWPAEAAAGLFKG
ncbi:MAG: leucyl/phenylalanyl-tRNA--protein transferase [Pseudazoarcus pumilus]|nr:leucyl/phenylalanyl-tRNA--protein transferase [Pseudazoarcus pumilus]